MIDLKRPIAELAAEVRDGKLKAADLVQASLEAIKKHDGYHAILEVSEVALERARQIDAGNNQGRLAGIPFIAKDNFLTAATHTTAASNILKPFKAPYRATAIEKLEAEGAIMVAKANLDAFAHGSSTENSDFGPTKNPHDKSRVPGGSSGGSAASVALGLACFALGTDTGGSIRQPAAFSGVVGLKPTYGLVSRYGVAAMGSSFDVIGPLTNTVADTALVLDVLAGKDPADATTIERDSSYAIPGRKHSASDGESDSRLRGNDRGGGYDLKGKRIGLIKEYLAEGTELTVKKAVMDAVGKLKAAGAKVEEASLPSVGLALACYYILVPAEVSSNLSRYDGIRFGHSSKDAKNLAETFLKSRDEGFGAEAKRRVIIGTYVLSSGYYDAYYKRAQKVRTLLIKEFNEAFKNFDLLVSPTAPTTAFELGAKSDPLAMYQNDIDTVAVNLAGNCAISIPCGSSQGLPIGLQLIAPQKGEKVLLAAAAEAEELLP